MPLSATLRASRVKVPRSRLALTPHGSLLALLQFARATLHRMCVMVTLQRACAALVLSGRLLAVVLLLDTVYFACVYETAVLPLDYDSDNMSDAVNTSYLSSPSSPSINADVPVSASLSSSPSGSLSSAVETKSRPVLRDRQKNKRPPGLSLSSHLREMDNNNNVSVNNLTQKELDIADNTSQSAHNSDSNKNSDKHNHGGVKRITSPQQNREFPMALVLASSIAAVSILVFFCLSYVWHTRQLDRRAQKLAIRLAAEADTDMNCSQCRTPASYMRAASQDSASDSGAEEALHTQMQRHVEELNSLNEEDEEAEDAEGRRRKPGGVGRTLGSRRGRGRGSRRYGSRSSRKWSGNSSGQNRSSLVTDQEILNHFASRRHSTFFI